MIDKKFFIPIAVVLLLSFSACQNAKENTKNLSPGENNDFYDDETFVKLGEPTIKITGEIKAEYTACLEKLTMRQIITKETLLNKDGNRFIGAYQYRGCSLADLLKDAVPKKENNDFNQVVDLYVIVSNDSGENAVFSWGEIFYPVDRHKILIATEVAPILPSKVDASWAIPQTWKLVAGKDLITERNISRPSKIEVVSVPDNYREHLKEPPFYSKSVIMCTKNDTSIYLKFPKTLKQREYPVVFYGRGRGIHGVTNFKGFQLKDLLQDHTNNDQKLIREGILVLSSVDGYRCAYSMSEIINRNDQSDAILIEEGKKDGGHYRLLMPGDFFSDRAIQAISKIEIQNVP